VEGGALLQAMVMIDQSPIGRTPRSNPVTYIQAFDLIRTLFSQTPEAIKRHYSAGHFSFNVSGGRCEVCQGDGTVTVEMQFLADVELICEECKGTRFKSGILDGKLKDLRLAIEEAIRDCLTDHGDSGAQS
jgi:excinuclease ABC subunit A